MFVEEEFVNKTLIQTYVWHGNTCFFVSTINRRCSSMIGGVYAETLAWEWYPIERRKGVGVGQAESSEDSIYVHQQIVDRLYKTGKFYEQDED